MKKLIKWHQEIMFIFMEKLNIDVYQLAWISWIKGLIIGGLLVLLSSCGVQFQYGLLDTAGNFDAIYNSSNDTELEIDTISSVQHLQRKLRTDFNFRYDFAQYAIQQPYSWYWNNPRLEGIWRPYNRFDVYFYSNWFWNDWAFNYPFNYGWGINNWNNWYWNRPWYGWNRPYSPWNNWNNNWYNGPFANQGYNVVWNSSRRGRNIAYINGNRNNIVTNNIQSILNNNRRVRNTINTTNYNKPLVINNNDQVIKLNTRTTTTSESNSNGWWRGNRQVVPPTTTRSNFTPTIQPRQIRGGSRTSIPQQSRSSFSTSSQRRGSSGGKRN